MLSGFDTYENPVYYFPLIDEEPGSVRNVIYQLKFGKFGFKLSLF